MTSSRTIRSVLVASFLLAIGIGCTPEPPDLSQQVDGGDASIDADSSADAGKVDSGADSSTPLTTQLTNSVVIEGVASELDPTKKYRIGLIWAQLNDDGPDPLPEIAVDLPFDAATPKVTLPSAFAAPSQANLLCERDCNDESQCGCKAASPYRFGFGVLVLVEDTNSNGKIDLEGGKLTDAQVAIGYGAIIYSENGGDVPPPSKQAGVPFLVDGAITQGASGYIAYHPDAGSFDRIRLLSGSETIRISKTKQPNFT